LNGENGMKKIKGRKGFSLIELIVVIAIIGILAAIVVPNFTRYLERGRVTTAVTDATQLASNINTLNLTVSPQYSADNPLPEASVLRDMLIAKNLLPQLSFPSSDETMFGNVLSNIWYNPDTRLFEARSRDYIAANGMDGY